jgi:dolichol-phosphate mannosyltransferase
LQVTVVIPTYNEAENLPKLVSAIFNLPVQRIKILIIDDNSPDGTGEIARDLSSQYKGKLALVQRPGKLGLGTAYVNGFKHALAAGAEAIAQMDADFSHPPEVLVDLISAIKDHDVVMGSRYIEGGAVDQRWPTWRKGLSAFGNYYARTILRMKIRDATGGFRVWRSTALDQMPLDRVQSNGYAFQVEMAYIAQKLRFKFLEVPFYFADRRWGISKMSIDIQIEAAIRVWQLLFEYRDLHPMK